MTNAPAYTYAATVMCWVDGDTVDLRVDLGFRMWTETRFRLIGIDTPERGQNGFTAATDAAISQAPIGAPVIVHSQKDGDKWGRWLADIETPQGLSINKWLLETGHARPYP